MNYFCILFTVGISITYYWQLIEKSNFTIVILVIGFLLHIVPSLIFLKIYNSEKKTGIFNVFSKEDKSLIYLCFTPGIGLFLLFYFIEDFIKTSIIRRRTAHWPRKER